MLARLVFFASLAFVGVGHRWASPPVALALGVAFGLLFAHPYAKRSKQAAKQLLQLSVVLLGFSMNLREVLEAGRSGFLYTLGGIAFALGTGTLLARLLGVPARIGYLVSVGTAICGGSAIAAIGPVSGADDEEMSISIGTVFVLNAVGLVVFPPIGHALAMSERAFGLWAALALHDTSSVVGAGAKYGPVALAVATTVKLARALWIVPLTLATAAIVARGRRAGGDEAEPKIAWPWFIGAFLVAATLATYVKPLAPFAPRFSALGRWGLGVTLFLIGTGMSRASLRAVGLRPLVHGVALWIAVALTSLAMVRAIGS